MKILNWKYPLRRETLFFEDLKNDGENFRLEDLKDELLGSAVSDKFKEDDFDDVNRIRRFYI